jgi:ferritin-like metal-binding protein YciE
MIQTHLSDALVLERHINLPLKRQLQMDDAAKFSEAAKLISNLKVHNERHILGLETQFGEAGGQAASPVKSAWTQLLGVGAATIDNARKTRVSKNLRDDYTALALATASYTMLNTTALGLGDNRTAKLAQQHLEDYAQIVVRISEALPSVVLQELAIDGEIMRVWAARIAEQNTEDTWK